MKSESLILKNWGKPPIGKRILEDELKFDKPEIAYGHHRLVALPIARIDGW